MTGLKKNTLSPIHDIVFIYCRNPEQSIFFNSVPFFRIIPNHNGQNTVATLTRPGLYTHPCNQYLRE